MSNLLALDQSSHTTGYAIFQDNNLIISGTFNAKGGTDIGKRLVNFKQQIKQFIDQYHIDYVIYENIQMEKGKTNNVVTFKMLAEVIGVLEEMLTSLNIPHEAVFASTWRSTLGFGGRNRDEEKANAKKYILKKFNKDLPEDESEAVCIGLHYNYTNNNPNSWS